MTEEQRQMEMHKKLHAELAATVRPYLAKGIWRSLVLGAFDDVKLVAMNAFLDQIDKKDPKKN